MLYDSVSVQTDPELKDALLGNQLNAVECTGCQFSFRVDKSLLYNDAGNRFMVNLIPASLDSTAEACERFSEWINELTSTLPANIEAPDVHLVFNRAELVERIFMLEAGLNERIIEYVKHIIYSRNTDQLDPTRKALLFDEQDSTDENLCFVVQDLESQRLEGVLQYSRQAYQGLCEMFDRDDQTPSLMELFPGPYVSARALLAEETTAEWPGPASDR